MSTFVLMTRSSEDARILVIVAVLSSVMATDGAMALDRESSAAPTGWHRDV
jgi:hypothetical protein